jgi:hypothetical protein
MRAHLLTSAAVLIASTSARAAPSIDVSGACPAVTVRASGATPMRNVMLFMGELGGTTTLTSGPCRHTHLDVAGANDPANLLFTGRANGVGNKTATPTLAAGDCSNGVQWLDVATCETSEAVALDCSSLADGLVAYWPGNGNARDPVGLHHGTVEGTVNYVPGMFGKAFEFDGVSAVVIPQSDDLDYDDGEPFTYAMWLFNDSLSSPRHFLGKRDGCEPDSFDYQFVVVEDTSGRFNSAAGSLECSAVASPPPPEGSWQHVIASYDGDAWNIYVDGELAGTQSCGVDGMGLHLDSLRIGSSGSCGSSFDQGWIGLVDEVTLWDRTLDERETWCASHKQLDPGP